MAKKGKTPNAIPHKVLAREMVFTLIQKKYSAGMLTEMMHNAQAKGLVKTPADFRKWMVNECLEFANTLSEWLKR